GVGRSRSRARRAPRVPRRRRDVQRFRLWRSQRRGGGRPGMSRVERIEIPGPPAPRRLEDHSAESWRQAVASVLGQSIEMAQEAVLDLLAEGGGSILLVAPAAPGDGAWRAAVAGLHGLTRSIAKEYGRKGIRCNLLVG